MAAAGLQAQGLDSPDPPKPARHTLMLRAGGSAPGAGPAYEFLAVARQKIGVAFYGGISPLNTGVHKYSPFMETIGAAFLYGSKRWKGEIDLETTHYHEKGIFNGDFPPYSAPYEINDLYGAALLGVRRQSPWGGLFLKANVGPIVWLHRGSLRANPSASLAVGYTFGKTDWQRSMLLDKPAWRTRLALLAGVDRHFERATEGRYPRPEVTPNFGSGPSARVGAMLDVSGPQSPWGVRIGLSAVATKFYYEYGVYEADFYIPITAQFKNRLKGTGGDLNLRARYTIGYERPWIVQAGWYVSVYATRSTRQWSTFIPYWHDRPNEISPSTGPLVAVSKQLEAGRWCFEPFLEGRLSVVDDVRYPSGRTSSLTLGLMAWLPEKRN